MYIIESYAILSFISGFVLYRTDNAFEGSSYFSNCCRGFIVNFDYVNTVSGNDFLMQNGDYVPIKKRENQQVKKQYLTYELKDIIRE